MAGARGPGRAGVCAAAARAPWTQSRTVTVTVTPSLSAQASSSLRPELVRVTGYFLQDVTASDRPVDLEVLVPMHASLPQIP